MKEKVKERFKNGRFESKSPALKRHYSEILNPLLVAIAFIRLQSGFLDSHES